MLLEVAIYSSSLLHVKIQLITTNNSVLFSSVQYITMVTGHRMLVLGLVYDYFSLVEGDYILRIELKEAQT